MCKWCIVQTLGNLSKLGVSYCEPNLVSGRFYSLTLCLSLFIHSYVKGAL